MDIRNSTHVLPRRQVSKSPTASSQVCPKEERLAKYFPISKNISISISNCLTTYKYCFGKIGKTYVIDCRDYRKVLQRFTFTSTSPNCFLAELIQNLSTFFTMTTKHFSERDTLLIRGILAKYC